MLAECFLASALSLKSINQGSARRPVNSWANLNNFGKFAKFHRFPLPSSASPKVQLGDPKNIIPGVGEVGTHPHSFQLDGAEHYVYLISCLVTLT